MAGARVSLRIQAPHHRLLDSTAPVQLRLAQMTVSSTNGSGAQPVAEQRQGAPIPDQIEQRITG